MTVLLFTDNKTLEKTILENNKKNKTHPFKIYTLSSLRRVLKDIQQQSMVYLDISNLQDSLKRNLNFLTRQENIFFGIIDTRGNSADIAELIFKGMADYIKGSTNYQGLNEKRVKKVINYLESYRLDYEARDEKITSPEYIAARTGWDEIESGKEYTFALMYIGLDGKENMERDYDKYNLESAIATFTDFIEKHTRKFKGRLWHWSGFDGIYLFPFNGRECPASLCAMQIFINKFIYDVEESPFPNYISFRTGLHLGNIKYIEKNKGSIVSDSVNSIFHLGRRYTEPGNFYITEDIYRFLHTPIKPFFQVKGEFENRNIYRMKLPHPHIKRT